ncbi:MAG: NAD(P)-dependent oxidoreductase [Moraxellaceae bacterium]|nr:NAD(P)-dependent oxidoreductase [Moraxellaceae bacterium]
MGLMGSRMTARLLGAGYEVWVWNRSPDKCLPLVAQGATLAANLATIAQQCDVIMLCLSDTAAVESAVFGEQGLAHHAKSGQLMVDFSSITPDATRAFAARLQAQGVHWIDSPVSGGVMGAENGTLILMAGGHKAQIERLRPIAVHLGQKLTHMGEVGTGQITKICNQMIVASNAVLIAETVALATKAGVDATQLAPALAGGFADSLPLQILAPRMASNTFEPVQWKVQTLLKDLDNAVALAKENTSSTPISALASQLLRLHAATGASLEDLSSVVKVFKT